MKKNKVRICGRKTRTLPSPEMIPSRTKLHSQPCGSTIPAHAPRPSKPLLIRSIGACAQANTAWNIKNRIANRMTRPSTGWSTILSTCRVMLSGRPGILTAASSMRSAWRCAAQLGGVRLGPGALGRRQPTLADHLVDPGEEIACAAAPHRDRGDDGDPELGGQPVEVDLEPAMARDVEHIEREDHRPTDALEFEHETQGEPGV